MFADKNAWKAQIEKSDVNRPSVGKHVVVTSGKHVGKSGIVVWHGRNKFERDYYATPAQLHLRDIVGRSGFRVGIKTENETFYVDANKVDVIRNENTHS